jgi:hypothetical protein
MARIPHTNPRYRTKSEICADVSAVLKSTLHYGTKFAVLDDVVWVWSEFEGKRDGCRFWSELARRAIPSTKLIHEHVVPQNVIIRRLLSLRQPSAASVKRVLNRFCIGVVVTHDEDRKLTRLGLRAKMPNDWDGKTPWARYSAANIKVVMPD